MWIRRINLSICGEHDEPQKIWLIRKLNPTVELKYKEKIGNIVLHNIY